MVPSEFPVPPALESTLELLTRVRAGDTAARERLFARVLPVLTRWAHRRLPPGARDLTETDDLVQVTLTRALGRLDHFEPRGEGAFLAYLRQILLNLVRSEIGRARARPGRTDLDESIADPVPSVLERTVRRDTLERYERALAELTEEQRDAVLLRLEFGYGHDEIARALGKPSANAARMTVARALLVLARKMDVD